MQVSQCLSVDMCVGSSVNGDQYTNSYDGHDSQSLDEIASKSHGNTCLQASCTARRREERKRWAVLL